MTYGCFGRTDKCKKNKPQMHWMATGDQLTGLYVTGRLTCTRMLRTTIGAYEIANLLHEVVDVIVVLNLRGVRNNGSVVYKTRINDVSIERDQI